jgi:hypothetical protein
MVMARKHWVVAVSLASVLAVSGPAWADSTGDTNSNCHTGSKFLGAGGGDKGGCSTAASSVGPGTPGSSSGASGASRTAGPAAAIVAVPRTTG